MNAVAERIRLLVDGPPAWRPELRLCRSQPARFEAAREGNLFRYSDILILLRSTTRQPLLEQALHRYSIPYRVGGRGRGLFSRQEATDLLLFLKALTHPRDTLCAPGFLRSPWAGLSDETLLQLGWSGTAFDREVFRRRVLEGRRGGERRTGGRFAGARAVGRRARADPEIRRSRWTARPTSDLVREAIRETGFDAVLAAAFRGEQRLANLEKLLQWIEQTERRHGWLAAETAAEMEP